MVILSMKRRKVPSFRRLPKEVMWDVWGHMARDLSEVADNDLLRRVSCACRARDYGEVASISDDWNMQSIISGRSASTADTHVAASDALLARFLTKYCPAGEDENLHRVAICNFEEIDRSLRPHSLTRNSVYALRRIVGRLIGPAPSSDEVFNHCTHGPGSSAGISYQERFPFFKWSTLPFEVSPRSRPYVSSYLQADERLFAALCHRERLCTCAAKLQPDKLWNSDHLFTTRKSNVVTTVPKDSAKRRTIAKEPTWNMFLQLGLHGLLSRRLRRSFGVNLHSVRRNHDLAKRGSLDRTAFSPVTIDLSEASDRLSLELVSDLFDDAWFDWLSSTRSEYSELPDKSISLRKYASMGNGTTFVVQTIVYLAMAILACDRSGYPTKDIAVFGDDIILPAGAYLDLLNLLVNAGLKVNTKKSFVSGPFRETCGLDVYAGTNIRPVFYRKDYGLEGDLRGWLALRNLLWLWSEEQHVPLSSTLSYLDSYTQDIPPVFASLDLTSGAFTAWCSPLKDGQIREQLTWSSKARRLDRQVRDIDGFVFGKLSHDLRSCESESGSRFTLGSSGGRPRITHSPVRYIPDISRETLSWSRRF